MSHLSLCLWHFDETAAFWPFVAVGFCARAPKWRDASRWPWKGRVPESELQRGWPPLVVAPTTWQLARGLRVEVASQHNALLETHVADEQQQCDARRSALDAFVIRQCEMLTRRVTRSPELACHDHALESSTGVPVSARGLDGRAREITLKGVLAQEDRPLVLGDHVKLFCQNAVGCNTSSFLKTNRSTKVAISCRLAWVQDSTKELAANQSFCGCGVQG